jgi:protein-arginine kinase activator protein McsA
VIEGNDFLFLENMDSIAKEPDTESISSTSKQQGFSDLSLEELQQKLQEAIADEAYEKAARLRDELNKRNAK